jgi:hypothetical protein
LRLRPAAANRWGWTGDAHGDVEGCDRSGHAVRAELFDRLGRRHDEGGHRRPRRDLPRIQGAIADLKVTPEKILLTHGHIDHAGGAAELAELLSIPIEGSHEDDAPLLANLTPRRSASACPACDR